ncbi:MAG TPA: type II toxin-antitoxin system VapC family toxin [Pirellulales bacterium]|jgi:predicted nucleic acid-binding protein
MACLLDTGILLRAFDARNPQCRGIRQALRKLLSRQERLTVALQNIAEFWNVSTRPVESNGFGLATDRIGQRLKLLESGCEVLTESDESYRIWKGLLAAHSISGVAVHDARLVSVMLANGISTIVTLNVKDFRRYSGISAVVPSDV